MFLTRTPSIYCQVFESFVIVFSYIYIQWGGYCLQASVADALHTLSIQTVLHPMLVQHGAIKAICRYLISYIYYLQLILCWGYIDYAYYLSSSVYFAFFLPYIQGWTDRKLDGPASLHQSERHEGKLSVKKHNIDILEELIWISIVFRS